MATLILVILGLILLIKYIWPKFKKAVRNKDLTLAILIMVMSAIIFMPLFIVEGLFMIFEWDNYKHESILRFIHTRMQNVSFV